MEVPDQLVALGLEVLVAHLAVALAGRPAEQEIRAAAEGDQVDVVAAAGGVAQLIAGHGTQVCRYGAAVSEVVVVGGAMDRFDIGTQSDVEAGHLGAEREPSAATEEIEGDATSRDRKSVV